jgi:hypothetical protein
VNTEPTIRHTIQPGSTLLQALHRMATLAKLSNCAVTADYVGGIILVVEPGDRDRVGELLNEIMTLGVWDEARCVNYLHSMASQMRRA